MDRLLQIETYLNDEEVLVYRFIIIKKIDANEKNIEDMFESEDLEACWDCFVDLEYANYINTLVYQGEFYSPDEITLKELFESILKYYSLGTSEDW